MNKGFIALAAAGTMALAAIAAPSSADARCRGCGIGLGILGGAIVGSAIAGAAANPYYYGPDPYYAPPPRAYYGPGPYYAAGPACGYVRQRVWVDGVGWRWARVPAC